MKKQNNSQQSEGEIYYNLFFYFVVFSMITTILEAIRDFLSTYSDPELIFGTMLSALFYLLLISLQVIVLRLLAKRKSSGVFFCKWLFSVMISTLILQLIWILLTGEQRPYLINSVIWISLYLFFFYYMAKSKFIRQELVKDEAKHKKLIIFLAILAFLTYFIMLGLNLLIHYAQLKGLIPSYPI